MHRLLARVRHAQSFWPGTQADAIYLWAGRLARYPPRMAAGSKRMQRLVRRRTEWLYAQSTLEGVARITSRTRCEKEGLFSPSRHDGRLLRAGARRARASLGSEVEKERQTVSDHTVGRYLQ